MPGVITIRTATDGHRAMGQDLPWAWRREVAMIARKSMSPSRRDAPRRATSAKAGAPRRPPAKKRWSAAVMRNSDAMDLEPGVFKQRSASAVARSLKKSAEASRRRKSPPFRSAMSMLNFEINRGGKNLSPQRRQVLDRAKDELRRLFGRPPA
jgi:hypothetical protein